MTQLAEEAVGEAAARAVASLPEPMRLAVVLRYLGDLTEAQIADLMGMTRGGVSSLLTKADAALAKRPIDCSQEDPHGRVVALSDGNPGRDRVDTVDGERMRTAPDVIG